MAGEPCESSILLPPLATTLLPAVVRAVVQQHVVGGALGGFQRWEQRSDVLGRIPAFGANEPSATDARHNDT